MDGRDLPLRIAVAVQPPVFAETLARVLERPDLELVVVETPSAHYDGALVSGASADVDSDTPVVVHIPGPSEQGVGWVATADGIREVRLHTLEEVRGLVDELWARPRR